MAGTLIAPWLRKRAPLGWIIIGGDGLWALGLALVAASGSMLALAMAWLIMPAVSGIGSVVGASYRLSLIPPGMQGRVNSVFRFMAWGLQPLALAIGGLLVARVGPRETLAWLAAAMALTAVGAFASPLRKAA